MILVAMRQDDRLDLAHTVAKIGDIGQHEVDAEHIGFRKHHTAVEDHDLVVGLDNPHVSPDFASATE